MTSSNGAAIRGAVAALSIASLAACATSSTQLREIGDGAYSITERSTLTSLRSDNLKAKVEMDALAFCRDRGKALTVYDTRVLDPDPPAFGSATVQFRCVAP